MSQAKRLLKYLQDGHRITIMESYELFGITSLHRRLSDIREMGYEIEDEWLELPSGKQVKQYRLKQPQKVEQ